MDRWCPTCKRKIYYVENDEFCEECGGVTLPYSYPCPNCKKADAKTIYIHTKYCPRCGERNPLSLLYYSETKVKLVDVKSLC